MKFKLSAKKILIGGTLLITASFSSSLYAATVSTILGPAGNYPQSIVLDSAGNAYTTNANENTITKTSADGSSSMFANYFFSPLGMITDASGNLYVTAYTTNTVAKFTPLGEAVYVTTVGRGPRALTLDTSGNLYVANSSDSTVTKITPDGTASLFGQTGSVPFSIVTDSLGNVYTANYGTNNVTKISPSGFSATLASVGSIPSAITIDANGNLYTANTADNTVTKITPSGVASTHGKTGFTPRAITVDTEGNVYTANSGSNSVTKITPNGLAYTYGTTGSSPIGITLSSTGDVYTSNYLSGNITKITRDGTLPTIANLDYSTSNNSPSVSATHTVSFATFQALSDAAKTITITFPSNYDFTGKTISSVKFSHGQNTGLETLETLTATPTETSWGAVFSGTNNRVLTLTAPTDGVGASSIDANQTVIIKYDLTNSLNPATSGSADIVVSTAGDTGNILATISASPALVSNFTNTLSTYKKEARSSHTLTFTTPTGTASGGKTMVITFPEGYSFVGKTISSVKFSHGQNTGLETLETLTATPTATSWGAVFSGTNNRVLTLTAPTDGVGNAIVTPNDKIRITLSSANSTNPITAGVYTTVLGGTFANSGSANVTITR